MKFLSGPEIAEYIKKIMKEPNAIAVVAYIGEGISKYVSETATVVCNFNTGGTNPKELQTLMNGSKRKIRQYDNLHAKVYYSSYGAFVGSANLSDNGFGKTYEAGFFIDESNRSEYEAVRKWCESIINDDKRARTISKADIQKQTELYNKKVIIGSPTESSSNLVQDHLPAITLDWIKENPNKVVFAFWDAEDKGIKSKAQIHGKSLQEYARQHKGEDWFFEETLGTENFPNPNANEIESYLENKIILTIKVKWNKQIQKIGNSKIYPAKMTRMLVANYNKSFVPVLFLKESESRLSPTESKGILKEIKRIVLNSDSKFRWKQKKTNINPFGPELYLSGTEFLELLGKIPNKSTLKDPAS